jgi:hypothetical protein
MGLEIPPWAIAVAILFVSIIIIFSVLFVVRRRLLKRGTIGIDHQEKNIGSSQVTLNRSLSTFTSPPESPYTFSSSRTPDEKKSYFQCSTPTLVGPHEKVSIEATLPPPSSSFFSDKMELDSDEAQALYNAYVNVAPKNNGNIQQRAAALSTQLGKSIRRKSMANIPTSIVQFFEKSEDSKPNTLQPDSSMMEMSKATNLSSMSLANNPSSMSLANNPSTMPLANNPSSMSLANNLSTMPLANNPSTMSIADTHSTKIMIEDEYNIPFSPSSPAPLCVSEEDAAVAARKAIQSASRKSRTRSMIIADETAQAFFALIENGETVPTVPDRRNSVGILLDIKPPPLSERPDNNMSTIRKMLQSSWSGNNLKESASSGSLTSVEKPGKGNHLLRPMGSSNNT